MKVLKATLVLSSLIVFIGSGFFLAISHYPSAKDSAASVISLYNGDPSPGGTFVSLDAIIANSVSKLKDIASSSVDLVTQNNNEVNVIEVVEEEVVVAPKHNLGEAIVNITCIQKTREFTKKISGTGYFVSSSGAIMTNAHVAQFLLLKGAKGQGTMECSASTGLTDALVYDIELLYISPTWLLENASLISENNPKGSGESDFALLYVTGQNNGEEVSKDFAYLPPATSPLPKSFEGETVILVGYPKNNAEGKSTRTTATTTVKSLYTFGSGDPDIISLNESPLGYNGASGGPVIDRLGRSIGVITTKASGSTVLHAISMSHIDQSMKTEAGIDLTSVLHSDLKTRADLFNEIISPILQEMLAENL